MGSTGSTVGWVLKTLFLALLFLGLIEFLLLGVLASTGDTSKAAAARSATKGERSPHVFHPNFDHNYMASKRKVPNGPDPIHNRRAGDSRRPPGRA